MNLYSITPEDRGDRIFIRFTCNEEPNGYLIVNTADKELYDRLNKTITDYNSYVREKAGDIAPLTTRVKSTVDK